MNLKDYTYHLPDERIAYEPAPQRSMSKLLVYKQGRITHDSFSNISEQLPTGSTLFFNNTRVIPARIHFIKDTGALIEIFLLEPISPTSEVAKAMLVKRKAVWKCMVGNYKKWKADQTLTSNLEVNGVTVQVKATIADRDQMHIQLCWDIDMTFSELIEGLGKIPLPPYIEREVNDSDLERYQTVYSLQKGAVAAPTAGLHFDDEVLARLDNHNIQKEYLTLHVSAGTFQPIKASNVLEHKMHSEQVSVTRANITALLGSEFTIAVGTTSMRTLESLYWYGVKLIEDPTSAFEITQNDPYVREGELPTKARALQALLNKMDKESLQAINGKTEIFIYPGYTFRVCQGLITNYHLPGSTLILLVAAFVGEDWRKIYDAALEHNYRFLSYGDSSLLIP